MRRNTVAALLLTTIGLAAPLALAQQPSPGAQDKDLEESIALMRKDVRAQKADIMGKALALDSGQAATFWPLYQKYESELKLLGDERLAIINDYAANYQKLTDEKARELLDRSFALDEKTAALQRRYKDELLKVLPVKVVARFFQIERRLNLLIDIGIASEIPLVKSVS